jgi:hypothetical protein
MRILHTISVLGLFWAAPASYAADDAVPPAIQQEIGCDDSTQAKLYRAIWLRDQPVRELILASLAAASGSRDREKSAQLEKDMLAADAANQELLDAIVSRCGWPKGPFANGNLEAAFLVVQHGPRMYQLKYRADIDASHGRGELPAYAYRLFLARISNE